MLALEGIIVLDLTQAAPGGLCTMILADLGAAVIKIEPVSEVRGLGLRTSPRAGDREKLKEAIYDPLRRNKKSVGLNLKSDAGCQIFHRLAEKTDVIVEGFRPGVTKRLKIDYQTINELNPQIVYCFLSGYGQDGPYCDLPGHDVNYISMGGALNLIGDQDRRPVIPLNLVGDFAGGSLHAVIGIMAALIARSKTGKGQYVDIAYMDGVVSLLGFLISEYFLKGVTPEKGSTMLHGAYPYYGVYETKDNRYISIGCVEPFLWGNLCRALDKEEYAQYHFSPEHLFTGPKNKNWHEISRWLREVFLTKTRDEWFDFLSQRDVAVAKVYELGEVLSDPQVLHRQMVVEVEHPELGTVKQAGIAIKLLDTPGKIRSLAPFLGEHTDEVMLKLGYSSEEMESLREEGIIV